MDPLGKMIFILFTYPPKKINTYYAPENLPPMRFVPRIQPCIEVLDRNDYCL